ncbi:MAG: hypothetical protein HY731_03180 [Candidatus Tectomicrobia bacterium]|nr:hypothetical protein [Candidatus Tectomicrobia bacterium]
MKAKILTVGISLVLFIATLAFAQSRDRWGAGAGVPLAASPQVVLTHLSAER